MNRRQRGARRRRRTLQTWTIRQAEAAIPYIRSIVSSLREHHLAWQARRLDVQRLAAKPGRPDRTALIDMRLASDEVGLAANRALEAAEELADLDVFCLDPGEGQALVPFLYDDQLAWYLFDLFDEHKPLRYWRFDSDPTETAPPDHAAAKGRGGHGTRWLGPNSRLKTDEGHLVEVPFVCSWTGLR